MIAQENHDQTWKKPHALKAFYFVILQYLYVPEGE